MRNRIIHSFQTTTEDGEQILTTKMQKKDGNKQFDIDEGYLLDFIKKNETLNRELNGFREQNGAKKDAIDFFKNGASYDLVRRSIPREKISDEELREIYDSVQ